MAKKKGTKWDSVEDLGLVPDSVIAKRLGLTTSAVTQARNRRGIPSFTASQPQIDWDAQIEGSVQLEIYMRLFQ